MVGYWNGLSSRLSKAILRYWNSSASLDCTQSYLTHSTRADEGEREKERERALQFLVSMKISNLVILEI